MLVKLLSTSAILLATQTYWPASAGWTLCNVKTTSLSFGLFADCTGTESFFISRLGGGNPDALHRIEIILPIGTWSPGPLSTIILTTGGTAKKENIVNSLTLANNHTWWLQTYQGRACHTEDDGPTVVQKPVVHENVFHHLCPKNWSCSMTHLRRYFSSIWWII